MSFAKGLATDNPRGVNFVVETDFYYPLYSSISDLFPKDKKPTAPPTTVPPIPIENPKFDSISGEYFDIDTSDFWRRKVRGLY